MRPRRRSSSSGHRDRQCRRPSSPGGSNLVTDLGKLLDPIADKLLTGGALVCLVAVRRTRLVGRRRHPPPRDRHHPLSDGDAAQPGHPRLERRQAQDGAAVGGDLVLPHATVDSFLGDWMHWVNGALMTAAVLATRRQRPRLPGQGRAPREARVTAADELVQAADRPAADDRGRGVAHGWPAGLRAHRRPPAHPRRSSAAWSRTTRELKKTVLGVDAAMLNVHGAVHPDVAAQMASRVRDVLTVAGVPADIGVACPRRVSPGPDPQDGHERGHRLHRGCDRGRCPCHGAPVRWRPGGDSTGDRRGGRVGGVAATRLISGTPRTYGIVPACIWCGNASRYDRVTGSTFTSTAQTAMTRVSPR
jgi:hypothetical protein